MKIVTALANPTLNIELRKINNFEIIAPDIQYQDGVIEILEEKNNIDLLILSEIIPGDFSIYEFINEIKKKNNKIGIMIILENKKEELEKYLINNGIFNIYYNNEITINEIINILNEENNNIEISKENKIIKYKIKKKLNKIKEKNCNVISILGSYESGKSIFSIILSKSFKNKKVLLIDFDILNNSIHSILGIKKYPNKNKDKVEIKNLIYKYNKNLDLICGVDLLFKNKITNTEIKKLIAELKLKYDYIILDTSSECFYDVTRFLIRNSNECIFLLEANLLEIKKAKKLLSIYIEEWNIKKEKINIVLNKYNYNSIEINLLKNIFFDFKILGKINYDTNYNLLINRNFNQLFKLKKIDNQYKNIIKNLKG